MGFDVCGFPFVVAAARHRHHTGLNVLAKAKGKLYFGSATDNPELTDPAYVAGLDNTKDFGQITPVSNNPALCFDPRDVFSHVFRGTV